MQAGKTANVARNYKDFFGIQGGTGSADSPDGRRINASQLGDLAWFFADGQVVLSSGTEQRRAPYRITGVLERHGDRWLWRQFHGSEPSTDQ